MLLSQEEFDTYKNTAVDSITRNGYKITISKPLLYPHNPDEKATTYFLASILLCTVTNDEENKRYQVVIGFRKELGEDKFFFHCEDNFLEAGGKTKTTKETIIQRTLLDPAILNDRADFVEDSLANVADQYPESISSAKGHFWKGWNAGQSICKHVSSALATLTDINISDLKEAYEKCTSLPAKTTKPGKVSPLVAKLQKYAFRKHVLIEGEKGSGKTFGLDKYITDEKWDKEFIGGHEGIESIDLLGYFVKYSEVNEIKSISPVTGSVPSFSTNTQKVYNDRLVWKDGPLTAAFRKAARGEHVVLMIDEMLRIPSRELNILVAALTPNSVKQYVLRTGNIVGLIDNVAVEETIKVPTEFLWVVGTTNVGAGYDVDEIDEAMADRFRIIRKDNDRSEIKAILTKVAKASKLTSSVKDVLSFYDSFQKMKEKGQLTKILNLRHLCEAIELASTPDEITENLMDMIPVWAERTPEGYPEPAQVKLLESLINGAAGA